MKNDEIRWSFLQWTFYFDDLFTLDSTIEDVLEIKLSTFTDQNMEYFTNMGFNLNILKNHK